MCHDATLKHRYESFEVGLDKWGIVQRCATLTFLCFKNVLWSFVEFNFHPIECSQLPSVERAFVPDEYKKVQYQTGDVIYFSCDPGYTTGFNTTYICTEQGWGATTYGQCVALTNGHALKNSSYFYVDGTKVAYRCDNPYTMTGGSYKTCSNGQWTGDLHCHSKSTLDRVFSVTMKNCDVGFVPDGVMVLPGNVRQIQKGQSLRFLCHKHFLQGAALVTCLEDGQWSDSFPSCTDPASCGSPPPLDNGDFIASTTQFEHNTRVDYQCQSKYVMQGEPYKTCLNGVWTGEITCLKPCTINSDLIIPNKIQFKYKKDNKLYIPHDDHITFACIRGATHDNDGGMRRKCVDGVMILPRCV
uniref:Sushi domain-containing protein n=1 Tax=Neogobius melanostomus TaxID=47308 RepID=A0A8C6WXR8_9GOBI